MRVPHRPSQTATEATSVAAQPSWTQDDKSYGVRSELLIPGRGEPISDGAMIVEDGKIQWVGAYSKLPDKFSAVSFTKVPGVIMPGMWDVHTHFSGSHVVLGFDSGLRNFLPGYETMVGAAIVDDLRATLMAGFTSVRELGGYAGYLQPIVDKGFIVGPTVYSALAALSITGGHGDQHDAPLSTVLEACQHGTSDFGICDGVDDCIRTVRKTIRAGAKVIKVCSTGGVLSLNDQPEDSQFSAAELEAIVQEAARSGRVVASHAIGKEGIMSALRAGVKSIEHGMYLDQEVADMIKEKNAILVPTRHIVEALAADPSELPPLQYEKFMRMLKLSRESYKFAVKEGVRIALGTDTLSSDRKHRLAHGKNAMELHWMVVAGLTPLQAIEAATATPPETLGKQGPKAGQLKPGFDADFIAVASNPLDDIDVLTEPDNITHVWKGGKIYKST